MIIQFWEERQDATVSEKCPLLSDLKHLASRERSLLLLQRHLTPCSVERKFNPFALSVSASLFVFRVEINVADFQLTIEVSALFAGLLPLRTLSEISVPFVLELFLSTSLSI